MSALSAAATRVWLVLRGLLYSAGFVALWAWIATWATTLDRRFGWSLPGALRIPGLAIAIAGGLLAAACIATFLARGDGTPAPFDPPRRFVASGPYRYVRNPMYIGGFGVLLGAALVARSPAVVGVALGFLLLMHLLVLFYEEPTLERQFGESYREYRRTVSRWLPKRPPARER